MNPANTIVELRQMTSPALLRISAALGGMTRDGSPFDILAGQRIALLSVCAIMDALPNAPVSLVCGAASGIAAFLRQDFQAIVTEEEEGLLPRLSARLLLGDDLEDALRQLAEEHRRDRQEAYTLATRCDELATGLANDEISATYFALRAFAERQRRHLAWEDAIVFPLARDRLTPDDLSQWKQAMRKHDRFLS